MLSYFFGSVTMEWYI